MKKSSSLLIVPILLGILSSCSQNKTTITYSLYPYLLDEEHYRSVVENEWKNLYPDVEIKFIEYDCYLDGKPEGIDVIMYDSCLENTFVENGYIQKIDINDIDNPSDFFDYVLTDLYKDNALYGIPAIMCSNFLIYDKNDTVAKNATCIEDLSSLSSKLVANVDYNYQYFYNDYLMDKSGQYIQRLLPSDPEKTALQYFRNICQNEYLSVNSYSLADAYLSNKCQAFYSYSECLSLIGNKLATTEIKPISMADKENIPLYYADIVGLSSSIKEDKKDICLKLMNLICSAKVVRQVAFKNGSPSFLLFPRKNPYHEVMRRFPHYQKLYEYASKENNHIFR